MKPWLERNARRLEKPRQLLPPCIPTRGGIWADIGCGEGIFTTVLYELVGPECEIYAVDKNPNSLQRLAHTFLKMYPRATLHALHADFRLPLDLPELNGFVMANSLHFVKDNRKYAVLNQLTTHLKPEGRVIIIEYNARRGNVAVPHPLRVDGFLNLAKELDLKDVQIAARVPSSFMGEMYAGVGIAPLP